MSGSSTPPYSVWNVLWEANVGGNDYMTTGSYAEYRQYPGLGQNFYVPAGGQFADLPPLFRLSSGPDHMASALPNEGGYTNEGVLGYPFTNPGSLPGLNGIRRVYNGSDHATVATGTGIAGYSDDGPIGNLYGYMRYRTEVEAFQTCSGGAITEQSDLIAGGAVARWWWNGINFINTSDYGRYMQADIFSPIGDGRFFNPIEAGSLISNDVGGDPVLFRHGSPCVLANVSGNVHQTRAVPIDYLLPPPFGPFPKNDVDHLYLYQGIQIGKDLTLGWNGMPQVAQYKTIVGTVTPFFASDVEVPTAYLNEQFKRFYQYDPLSSNPLSEISVGVGEANEVRWIPPQGYGGVIIGNDVGSAAMGVYAVTDRAGTGSRITRLSLANFIDDDPGTVNSTKWGVRAENFNLNVGTNEFRAYIVTGTTADVANIMQQLYAMGAN
ncbi:hypothetical protein [Roseomonas haemaphysalidis]|uniref:Uncharacterized protein n=1 Tax=Roseomonas haemaphysalidis TaxID=2768162 RepID=A0ABS3KW63_9PROT|nr:hypothetical protein [Roseomonas haemaphysalidis]MBO1081713.1 hypothetical protein [Roseomonas haemaphysalidis]